MMEILNDRLHKAPDADAPGQTSGLLHAWGRRPPRRRILINDVKERGDKGAPVASLFPPQVERSVGSKATGAV